MTVFRFSDLLRDVILHFSYLVASSFQIKPTKETSGSESAEAFVMLERLVYGLIS